MSNSKFSKILLDVFCQSRRGGSWATYEKAHRARLTKTFVPKFPQLPAEIVPTTIVARAFHTGWY